MSEVLSVPVDTASARYEVLIADGLLDEVGGRVRSVSGASKVALITDSTVSELFGPRAIASLEATAFEVIQIEIPAGEASKSWARAGQVLEAMADAGLDRSDIVVALGGGVVGDLAGFCASAYMRGVAFAQVPTTLLAQVDSSVGGKTAVDLDAGKNLAGAFVQPAIVLADVGLLKTLPAEEWTSGIAEVAKSAVLDSEASLAWAEDSANQLAVHRADAVFESVRMSVSFKARIVAGDERETGARESLNLGHTFGHALEKVAGYGVIPHGHAVAEGMRFAASLAVRVGASDREMLRRQEALLGALAIPRVSVVYDVDELRGAMSSDKKARDGKPRFVFAVEPGRFVVQHVDESDLLEELRAWSGSTKERVGAL